MTPITRREAYLAYIAGTYSGDLPAPVTREEQLLYEIAVNGGGSSSGVTQAYVDEHDAAVAAQIPTAVSELQNDSGFIDSSALDDYVEKVTGKGLSSNDYTDEEKQKLASLKNYDDTDIQQDISDIQAVIPSTASSENKLTTESETALKGTTETSPISDSADGMVQGLTIYGASEVTEDGIKSVGDNGLAVTTANTDNTEMTSAEFATALPLRGTLDGTTRDELIVGNGKAEVITRCEVVDESIVPLAVETVTPLTATELAQSRQLRTYDNTTNITITDYPEFKLDYLKNTDNGQAIADVQAGLQEQINILREYSDNGIYGFIEHMDVLSPSERIEYIGANKIFSPVTVNKTNGTYDLGDWEDFVWLKYNKPYMVKSDGAIDYQLDETDYTKKLDGTASDVSNQSYAGGAFSLAKCIYKSETVKGNDRIVKFSMTPRTGFEPVGFKDEYNNVLGGRWIPMFYGSVVDGKATSIAGTQPSYNIDTTAQYNAIAAFSSKAKFLGGAFVETLIDLMYMFAGTTDIQSAFGNGNMSGYVNDASQYYGVKANAVVGGGQFYGTSDGTSLNKIFHSIVLGSYQQWLRDPYELVVNGKVKVSKNYTYDLSGSNYFDTGIIVPDTSGSWKYPLKYITVEDYGSIPDINNLGGSTATGVTDGTFTAAQSPTLAVSLRFGQCHNGATDGVRARIWDITAALADWSVAFAVLL